MPAPEGDISRFGMAAAIVATYVVWSGSKLPYQTGIKNARSYVERLNRAQGSRLTAVVIALQIYDEIFKLQIFRAKKVARLNQPGRGSDVCKR